ncbi:hypothetical protein F7725_019494 [Dissostichus mawsoni]|uniref:Neuroblastoma-amplified sequence N-terminal domain-containing protein n=1 Tax=Dissostichus mawsoni TaxID=36200 RepID=A0A7J5YJZ3_DISMA|nr:hypothetical protein F7725_019494 [Dissostichus mawsoni]
MAGRDRHSGWSDFFIPVFLVSNGKLLAVVQDQCVEIRITDFASYFFTDISQSRAEQPKQPHLKFFPGTLQGDRRRSVRDDFGSIIGKCQVCVSAHFHQHPPPLFLLFVTVTPSVSFPGDFSCAVAGLIFLEYTGSAHWSAELLVITVGTNQNFQENHSFNKEQYYPLEDVSWWSDVVLILSRCSGSVTVSSVRTLRNLLGKSCEWLEPSPRVTAAHEVVFLSLEVESLEVERTDEAMQDIQLTFPEKVGKSKVNSGSFQCVLHVILSW